MQKMVGYKKTELEGKNIRCVHSGAVCHKPRKPSASACHMHGADTRHTARVAPCSMLMPAPFDQRHNGYLRAYQNTGGSRILPHYGSWQVHEGASVRPATGRPPRSLPASESKLLQLQLW